MRALPAGTLAATVCMTTSLSFQFTVFSTIQCSISGFKGKFEMNLPYNHGIYIKILLASLALTRVDLHGYNRQGMLFQRNQNKCKKSTHLSLPI